MQPARNEDQMKIFKLITVIYITAIVTMTSLLNFSLALLIAVLLVPMILSVDVTQKSKRYVLFFDFHQIKAWLPYNHKRAGNCLRRSPAVSRLTCFHIAVRNRKEPGTICIGKV